MEERPWAHQLSDLANIADRATAALRDVEAWVWDNSVATDVLPRQLPAPLGTHLTALERDLNTSRELAQALFARFSSNPSGKLLAGWTLSREEYYLCRAMGMDFGGAQELGLAELNDYEVYRMLCYEDEQWVGYINVNLTPHRAGASGAAMRFGRAPEECRRRCLRPEQHDFFQKYSPRVYERFME